jgi:ABC-type hemin transport system ATPase subunit
MAAQYADRVLELRDGRFAAYASEQVTAVAAGGGQGLL